MAELKLNNVTTITESSGSLTLANAALGTPTSGVVTNLSGVLPVGVTGGSGLEAVPGRYFHAFKDDASNQAISAGVWTLCTFESVVQSHTSFSNANDFFTAVAADAGNWFFVTQISFYLTNGTLNNPLANIYHNDSNVMGGYKLVLASTQTINHYSVTTSGVLTIATGDTIKLYGHMSPAGFFFGGDTAGIKGTSIVGIKL